MMVNEYIFVVFLLFIYNLFTKLYLWKSDKESIFFFTQTLIDLFTLYNMTSNKFLMKYTSTIGESILQFITNWVTTKGTSSGQKGATRDKSTRTGV